MGVRASRVSYELFALSRFVMVLAATGS